MNQNGSLSTIGDSCVNCCLKFVQAEFKNGIRRKLSPENFSLLAKLYEIDVPSMQRTIGSSKLEDLFVCRQCFNKLNSLCKAKEKLLNLEKDLKSAEENLFQRRTCEILQNNYSDEVTPPSSPLHNKNQLISPSSSPNSPPKKKKKIAQQLFVESRAKKRKYAKHQATSSTTKVVSKRGSPIVQVFLRKLFNRF